MISGDGRKKVIVDTGRVEVDTALIEERKSRGGGVFDFGLAVAKTAFVEAAPVEFDGRFFDCPKVEEARVFFFFAEELHPFDFFWEKVAIGDAGERGDFAVEVFPVDTDWEGGESGERVVARGRDIKEKRRAAGKERFAVGGALDIGVREAQGNGDPFAERFPVCAFPEVKRYFFIGFHCLVESVVAKCEARMP